MFKLICLLLSVSYWKQFVSFTKGSHLGASTVFSITIVLTVKSVDTKAETNIILIIQWASLDGITVNGIKLTQIEQTPNVSK
jgi:hypothetical protein